MRIVVCFAFPPMSSRSIVPGEINHPEQILVRSNTTQNNGIGWESLYNQRCFRGLICSMVHKFIDWAILDVAGRYLVGRWLAGKQDTYPCMYT